MVLKENVLTWCEAEIKFQNINSKGMHHMIHKTGTKLIRINNVYLEIFTKMNLSLIHYCIHLETSQLTSRGY